MLLRFQEDAAREVPVMNVLKVWSLPARHASIVIGDLNNMIFDLYARFLDVSGQYLDIRALANSDSFRYFALATSELQRVCLHFHFVL